MGAHLCVYALQGSTPTDLLSEEIRAGEETPKPTEKTQGSRTTLAAVTTLGTKEPRAGRWQTEPPVGVRPMERRPTPQGQSSPSPAGLPADRGWSAGNQDSWSTVSPSCPWCTQRGVRSGAGGSQGSAGPRPHQGLIPPPLPRHPDPHPNGHRCPFCV